MALRKRNSGRYQLDIRYRDTSGKKQRFRIVLPESDPQSAQNIHDAIEGYLREGEPKPLIRLPNGTVFDWKPDFRPGNAGIYTIGDLVEGYVDFLPRDPTRELRSGSMTIEISRAETIGECIGGMSLNDCGQAVSQFIVDMRNRYAPQTRYHYHGTLDRIFRYGIERGVIAINPMERIPSPKVTRPPIYPLDQDELDAFLSIAAGISHHWEPFFAFAAHTGLRLGELRGLMTTDVGQVRPVVHVARSINTEHQIGPTKNRGNRYVPLSSLAQGALARNRRTGNSRWLFTTPDGRQVLPSSFRKTFRKVVRELNRPHPLRFHDLRHTFATHCLNAGVPIKRVSLWLGHESVKTTERRYDGMTAMGDGVERDLDRLESYWVNEAPKLVHFGSTSPKTEDGNDS